MTDTKIDGKTLEEIEADAKMYLDGECSHRCKTIIALCAEVWELREELSRVQRLPDQEWAAVGAILLRILAKAARDGFPVKETDAVAAIDRGQTYVDRILASRDKAEARVKELEAQVEILSQYETSSECEKCSAMTTLTNDKLSKEASHLYGRIKELEELSGVICQKCGKILGHNGAECECGGVGFYCYLLEFDGFKKENNELKKRVQELKAASTLAPASDTTLPAAEVLRAYNRMCDVLARMM